MDGDLTVNFKGNTADLNASVTKALNLIGNMDAGLKKIANSFDSSNDATREAAKVLDDYRNKTISASEASLKLQQIQLDLADKTNKTANSMHLWAITIPILVSGIEMLGKAIVALPLDTLNTAKNFAVDFSKEFANFGSNTPSILANGFGAIYKGLDKLGEEAENVGSIFTTNPFAAYNKYLLDTNVNTAVLQAQTLQAAGVFENFKNASSNVKSITPSDAFQNKEGNDLTNSQIKSQGDKSTKINSSYDVLNYFTQDLQKIKDTTPQTAAEIETLFAAIPNYSVKANQALVDLVKQISKTGEEAKSNAQIIINSIKDQDKGGTSGADLLGLNNLSKNLDPKGILGALDSAGLIAASNIDGFEKKLSDVQIQAQKVAQAFTPEQQVQFYDTIINKLKEQDAQQKINAEANQNYYNNGKGFWKYIVEIALPGVVARSNEFSTEISLANSNLQIQRDLMNDIVEAAKKQADFEQAITIEVKQQESIDDAISQLKTVKDRLPKNETNVQSNAQVGNNGAIVQGSSERDLLAKTLVAEDTQNMDAVLGVIRNRVASGYKGATSYEDVIKQPYQFQSYTERSKNNFNNPNPDSYKKALDLIDQMGNGNFSDPTNGATSFYNPSLASPKWGPNMTNQTKIGQQVYGNTADSPQVLQADQLEQANAAAKRLSETIDNQKERQAGVTSQQKLSLEVLQQSINKGQDDLATAKLRLDEAQKQADLSKTANGVGYTESTKTNAQIALLNAQKEVAAQQRALDVANANYAASAAIKGSKEELDSKLDVINKEKAAYAEGTVQRINLQKQAEALQEEFTKHQSEIEISNQQLVLADAIKGSEEEYEQKKKINQLKQNLDKDNPISLNNLKAEAIEIDDAWKKTQDDIAKAKANLDLASMQPGNKATFAKQKQVASIGIDDDSSDQEKIASATRLAEIQKQENSQKLQNDQLAENTSYQLAMQTFQQKQQLFKSELAAHTLTRAQEVVEQQNLNQQELSLTESHYANLLKLVKDNEQETIQIENQRILAIAALKNKEVEQNQAAQSKIQQQYMQTSQQAAQVFGNAITGIITKQSTLEQASKQLLTKLLGDYITYGAQQILLNTGIVGKDVATLVTGENLKTAAVVQGNAARTSANTAGAGVGAATTLEGVIKSITASAGEAFAGVFGFLSPILGPAAAGPAAAAQATVMGHLPSFDVGAWNLPRDMVAQVHQGETILPAGAASAFRQMASGGGMGGGGDVHVHHTSQFNVSAMDGASVKKFFANNGGEIMKSINTGVKLGTNLGFNKLKG